MESESYYATDGDIAYIRVRSPHGPVRSEEQPWGLRDYDEQTGDLVGLEVWSASKVLPEELVAALPRLDGRAGLTIRRRLPARWADSRRCRPGCPGAGSDLLLGEPPTCTSRREGERGDSNPRPPGPQPGALPAELRPPCGPESSSVRFFGRRVALRPGARNPARVKQEPSIDTVVRAERTADRPLHAHPRGHLPQLGGRRASPCATEPSPPGGRPDPGSLLRRSIANGANGDVSAHS